jgi:hypothetical protein
MYPLRVTNSAFLWISLISLTACLMAQIQHVCGVSQTLSSYFLVVQTSESVCELIAMHKLRKIVVDFCHKCSLRFRRLRKKTDPNYSATLHPCDALMQA